MERPELVSLACVILFERLDAVSFSCLSTIINCYVSL